MSSSSISNSTLIFCGVVGLGILFLAFANGYMAATRTSLNARELARAHDAGDLFAPSPEQQLEVHRWMAEQAQLEKYEPDAVEREPGVIHTSSGEVIRPQDPN